MMNQFQNNSKAISKLYWFFIATGLIEIFVFIFLTTNFLAIIPGLITVIPAYTALNKMAVRRNFFVSIWAFIKYNPISLAFVAFIVGDLIVTVNVNPKFFIVLTLFVSIIGLLSLVFGILLIIKISKHNKFVLMEDYMD